MSTRRSHPRDRVNRGKMGRPARMPRAGNKHCHLLIEEINRMWVYKEADRLNLTLSQVVNNALEAARRNKLYREVPVTVPISATN